MRRFDAPLSVGLRRRAATCFEEELLLFDLPLTLVQLPCVLLRRSTSCLRLCYLYQVRLSPVFELTVESETQRGFQRDHGPCCKRYR